MSNILNIRIDEGATFTKVLTFTRTVTRSSQTHPITGVVTTPAVREPLPLTGYSFLAQLKDKLTSPTYIENMQVRILNASAGTVSLSMSREQTSRLSQISGNRTGVSDARVRRIGYYDVLAISPNGSATKVFQGECYLSRAVTVDPRASVTPSNALFLSPILGSTVENTVSVDSTAGRNYVGIRYYSNGIQVAPTGGSVQIFRRPVTSSTFPSTPSATLSAPLQTSEALIDGNAVEFRVVPVNIVGADSYQVVVSSNRS